jgi:hypothetical protein
MRYGLSSILAALAIGAFASITPAAAGNSGDANGMWEQAQIHPNETNQDPDYRPGYTAEGEVHPPGVISGGHFVRSGPANAEPLALLIPNCRMFRTDYGGWWFTECGP